MRVVIEMAPGGAAGSSAYRSCPWAYPAVPPGAISARLSRAPVLNVL
ncbi:hypothetical protein [Alloactinosynnema sp. L-07]|nr:hypothetical protein [Alloactinosynnema sp. L-07]